ncbi:DUF6461 domain-containing protein [Actinomadura litoris]|uniref:DUF6461 domain-containing protein n=1 Tax=Actinomadura litoris TaxID=2678616 RepID=UPI0035E457FE
MMRPPSLSSSRDCFEDKDGGREALHVFRNCWGPPTAPRRYRLRLRRFLGRFGSERAAVAEMSFEELGEAVGDFTMKTRGGSGSGYVGARQIAAWSMAVELLGRDAVLYKYFPSLSRGCEMVAVSRHDYAEDGFVYAVDGEAITGFTPHSLGRRWGQRSGPDQPGDARGRNAHAKLGRPGGRGVAGALEPSPGSRVCPRWSNRSPASPFTPSLLDGTFMVGAIKQRR